MSELQTSSLAVLVSPEICAPIGRRTASALHTCLIVSTSASRAQGWVRAAHEVDWSTIVCTTADDANRQSIRYRVHLALIDLQSAKAKVEPHFRGLVEQLASRGGPLLAVCGKPDDIAGEVWSRQLGVWMYLPGVDGESDISLLCSEAKNIVKKLGGETVYSPS